MPKFNVAVPHTMSQPEAAEKLKGFTEKIKEYYQDQVSDLEQSWEGDVLNFKFATFGMKVSGQMAVEEEQVVVSGDLPFAAAMFKGKIESGMREQLTKLLR